jgi:glutathione synthase/RimK-type ligase-like ATP-grasp enzyme
MKAVILRRRKLGLTSCREIANFSKTGITFVRNDKPIPEDTDLIIRWGCTSETGVKNTLNTAKAIHVINDKAGFRKVTADAGLSPKTWLSFGDFVVDEDDDPDDLKTFVVRKRNHSQGRDLDHCKTYGEIDRACRKYGEGNYYISEFIDKKAEYRVCVVSGRVAWIAKKTPADPKAVAWNVAQGGRFDNVRWDEWPLEAVRVAIEAFQVSGLDFGGVDVMVDADGKAYVLEINSAPSLTSPYRQECMSKCFDYIVLNGKNHIEPNWRKGRQITNYLNAIHPAIHDGARVNDQDEPADV